MVAKVRFRLLESSRSIAKASLSAIILKSSFLYSLFTTQVTYDKGLLINMQKTLVFGAYLPEFAS